MGSPTALQRHQASLAIPSNYTGSIDLNNRKVLNNPDGTISTEQSFGFSPDGETEILIPAVVNGVNLEEKYGKEVGQQLAKEHFFKTGEHLGVDNITRPGFNYKDWDKYAIDIHNRQDSYYNGPKQQLAQPPMKDIK